MKYSYERFLNGMSLRTKEQVTLNDNGYETMKVYHEEMDERFFTEEEFNALPDVCMVIAISYLTKSNEYLMMDVYDESNQHHVKTIWLKNGEVQLENY